MDNYGLKNLILDLIFPIQCISCGGEGFWLCRQCLNNIKKYEGCFRDFLVPNYLDEVKIIADYQDQVLEAAIHKFKYQFIADLGENLVGLVKTKDISRFKDYVLVPIPLHPKRLKVREFNQSEVLARGLAKRFNFKIQIDSLLRVKWTVPQMTLNRRERLANIKEIFSVNGNNLNKIKNVLLIDDVLTTGATLNEAARVLKRSGVAKIAALVLAHGR